MPGQARHYASTVLCPPTGCTNSPGMDPRAHFVPDQLMKHDEFVGPMLPGWEGRERGESHTLITNPH